MYFNCKCEVYVAGALVQTVNSVEINNEIKQVGATCEIELPLKCRIKNEGQYLIDTPQNRFKTKDTVKIYAWYEEYIDTYGKILLFEGYVWDFVEGTPLKMRCLDESFKFQKIISIDQETGTLKGFLKKVLDGTGVTISKDSFDFSVEKLSFPNQSIASIIEYFRDSLKIIALLRGKELLLNFANFKANRHILKSNANVIGVDLQKPDAAFQNIKIKMYVKTDKGTKEVVETGSEDGKLKEVHALFIKKGQKISYESKTQDIFDAIKANALNYEQLGFYKGKLTCLLYPNINLLDDLDYEDVRFKERSGIYSVRGLTTTLNTSGFHQELKVAHIAERG